MTLANSLLAALPRAEYARLLAGIEPVSLRIGEVLHESGVPIQHAYFPINCVIALLIPVKSRLAVKVALVGYEGMVGSPLALGISTSTRRAVVQVSGTAVRIEAGFFCKEILQSKPLQRALFRFKHALIGQIAQSAVCKQCHSVQSRLARFLLMTAERARSNEIRITHEYVAQMQGVRRAAIGIAAKALQKRKAIQYSRGTITVLDRKRLATASCDCYQVIKRLYSDSA